MNAVYPWHSSNITADYTKEIINPISSTLHVMRLGWQEIVGVVTFKCLGEKEEAAFFGSFASSVRRLYVLVSI